MSSLMGLILAFETCAANGKSINLNNGDSTKGLTALVVCKDDGRLARDMKYVGGAETVIRFYYDNGKLKVEKPENKAGNSHGIQKEYYESGQLQSERAYDNGEPRGLSKFYAKDGKVERIAMHLDTYKKTELEFNPDGSLRAIECSTASFSKKDRDLCGFLGKPSAVKLFVKAGQPFRELTFLKGEVQGAKELSDGGQVQKSEQFAKVGKDGMRTERFPNGRPKSETRYNKGGNFNGLQREFAESGQVTREATFNDGFMTKETLYYLNGQAKRLTQKTKQGERIVVASKDYFDGGQVRRAGSYLEVRQETGFGWGQFWSHQDLQEDGKFLEWREDGSLQGEELWRQGKREGLSRAFFEDGKTVFREETFAENRLARVKEYDKAGKLVTHDEYFADGSRKSHLKKKASK